MTTHRPLILGIDPGVGGAICLLDSTTNTPIVIEDMPILKGKGDKKLLDVEAFSDLIATHAQRIKFAVVEEVGAMTYTDGKGQKRGQGAAASFAFGKSTGQILGVITACMIPIFEVRPQTWKLLMGLTSSKDLSREKASILYSSHAHLFTRKKDDGRAEALLLAHFGRERFF
jgi:crossover junction endodeoxyribonuclease RuvC